MPHDETTRVNRALGLTPEDRLERIEGDISALDKKLDKILEGLAEGRTKFSTIELTIASLTHRVQRLEDGRDLVIKIVMTAVVVGVLGLLGLKAFG